MLMIFRIFLVIIWTAIAATVGIIACLIRPFNRKNIKITTNILHYGKYILGMKIIIRNKDILDTSRPCVFISNHQDNLDIFAGAFILPKDTVSIGKKDILLIPFFGLYYWLSGNILIDRQNKRKAFQAMDIAANNIKEKKISVWIMPEGTRSRGKGLLPFKKGPFITAIKADVPIVPVAWNNYIQDINLNKWHSCTIILEVLAPLSTKGLKFEDATKLKDESYTIMAEAIARLDAEVRSGKIIRE